MKRRKPHPGDDGRTVADMNVEGMPWYAPEAPDTPPSERLTRKQARRYTWEAMKAGLLFAGICAALLIGFILFCVEVWLK